MAVKIWKVLRSGVIYIGRDAFNGCTALAKISMPSTVQMIGSRLLINTAYYDNNVNWDADGNLYLNNWLISEDKGYASGDVTVKAGTVGIAEQAFVHYYNGDYRNSDLGGVSLPDGLKYIGAEAFINCQNLKKVELPRSISVIGDRAFTFGQFFVVPDDLKPMVISGTLTEVGEAAFKGRKINEVHLADSMTEIPKEAFADCSLPTIDIPSAVTYIGKEAFASNAFTQLTLPQGLTSISDDAFNNCSLKSITIPNGVTHIGLRAFSNNSIESVTLPTSLRYLGTEAFYNCLSLKQITIPEGTVYIDEQAFYGCQKLTQVSLPNTLKVIESSAFGSCWTLAEITIPESVVFVGAGAFSGSNVLKSITVRGTNAAVIGSAFSGCYTKESARIPAGHSYTTAVTKPTCTEQGYTTHICSKCGDNYPDSYTNAVGHKWDNGVITKQPTAAEDGIKTFTCTVCQRTKTESIPKLTPTPTVSFTDVPTEAYYAESVSWAVSKGVTNGTSPSTFAPDATCTRGQIVTFLYRDMV